MGVKVLPATNKCNEKDFIGITSSIGTLASIHAQNYYYNLDNKGLLTEDFTITTYETQFT